MVTVTAIDIEDHTYQAPFFNIETIDPIDWITIGTDVYTVVSGFVPDATEQFPVVPTTFGMHYDTPILLVNGEKYPIGRWFDENRTTKIGATVYSTVKKQFTGSNIQNVTVNYYTQTYTITISTGFKIKCSPNLPFLLHDGTFKKAEDLIVTDQLKSFFEYDNLTQKYSIAPTT